MNSTYITFDRIDPDNGAGKVCMHEINALSKVSDLKLVMCREHKENLFGERKIPISTINLDKVYPFNPFLYDYFVADRLSGTVDFAHFSCSPAIAMINKLKPKAYACNIVAHDLQLSISEHERIYQRPYPFIHNTDQYLHDALIKHAKGADVVFCPSSSAAKWIKGNINPKRIEMIPHGCDFPDNAPPLPDDKLRIGYMGAFGPDKGLLYLLMAWKHLNYKDAELVFGGQCCEYVKPWAETFAYGTNIRYTGWVEKPSDFFKEVNVVVAPSVSEGFGLIVVEGPAHGRALIATTGTGAPDVTNKYGSIIVPPRSAKELADAISYLHDNFDEVKKMGKEARKNASNFKWSIIEDEYERVYKEFV